MKSSSLEEINISKPYFPNIAFDVTDCPSEMKILAISTEKTFDKISPMKN